MGNVQSENGCGKGCGVDQRHDEADFHEEDRVCVCAHRKCIHTLCR